MLRTLLVTVALFAALAPAASAFDDPTCDRTWGGTTGNFGDGSKWVGGQAPNGNERGCFPAGAYTVTVTAAVGVKGVTVGAGVTLAINENQYLSTNDAGIINRGTITMSSDARRCTGRSTTAARSPTAAARRARARTWSGRSPTRAR